MSSRRLPVVGRPPANDEEIPPPADRPPCAEPTVVVVGATRTVSVTPFARAFEEAAAHAGARVVVETGVEGLRRCAPRLAVLVTGGVLPAGWDPAVRALEGAFDLVLAEPREAVARALATGW